MSGAANPRPEVTGGPSDRRARRIMAALLVVSFAAHAVLAALVPLVADEAYAVAVGREFSLSFFDHPPLGFWMPAVMAHLTGSFAPLIVRLPFIAAGVGTTGVMFVVGRELGGNRAGLWSALLFAAAPFMFLSGGMFIVPDGPLLLASSLVALCVLRALGSKRSGAALWWWLGAGAALALALMSKYHAAWLPVAVLAHLLSDPARRRVLATPGPWLGAFVGLFGLLPMLLWNLGHDWVSFAFHSGRAGEGVNPANFGAALVVQALYLLPTGLAAALVGVTRAGRASPAFLLALMGLGPVVVFNLVYLISSVPFGHWAMPGWLFWIPLAGLWVAKRPPRRRRRFARVAAAFWLVSWVALGVVVLQARTGLLTRHAEAPPRWDDTLALPMLGGLRGALEDRGLWRDTDVIAAGHWIDAGLIATALGREKPVRVLVPKTAHHFAYLSDAKARGRALLVALVLPRRLAATSARLVALARRFDERAEVLDPIVLDRGGVPYARVVVIRLTLP